MKVTFTQSEIELIAEVVAKVESGELDFDDIDHLYCFQYYGDFTDRLYEYFLPEMPYGIAKARTGDPSEFICEHLKDLLSDPSAEAKTLVFPGLVG